MSTTTLISVAVNGETREVAPDLALPDLLRLLGIDPEQPGIAVAVDGSVVRRATWTETQVEDGNEIEVITATQGG